MAPVNTSGSEYLAKSASGSLETAIPSLFAAVNWNLGNKKAKTGASTYHFRQQEMLKSKISRKIRKYNTSTILIKKRKNREVLTVKIGWEGWIPTAGEVNTMPAMHFSIFGSRTACSCTKSIMNNWVWVIGLISDDPHQIIFFVRGKISDSTMTFGLDQFNTRLIWVYQIQNLMILSGLFKLYQIEHQTEFRAPENDV